MGAPALGARVRERVADRGGEARIPPRSRQHARRAPREPLSARRRRASTERRPVDGEPTASRGVRSRRSATAAIGRARRRREVARAAEGVAPADVAAREGAARARRAGGEAADRRRECGRQELLELAASGRRGVEAEHDRGRTRRRRRGGGAPAGARGRRRLRSARSGARAHGGAASAASRCTPRRSSSRSPSSRARFGQRGAPVGSRRPRPPSRGDAPLRATLPKTASTATRWPLLEAAFRALVGERRANSAAAPRLARRGRACRRRGSRRRAPERRHVSTTAARPPAPTQRRARPRPDGAPASTARRRAREERGLADALDAR